MSEIPPFQRWVRQHKRDLTRLGIRPMQVRRGAFAFALHYSGVAPYFGRRWAGMIHDVTVVPHPDGTFVAHGHRVADDQAATLYRLVPTGTLAGDFARLLEGDCLVTLLGRLKLCGGGHDPGGPTLPPPPEIVRLSPTTPSRR
jgi:hypothetical protein